MKVLLDTNILYSAFAKNSATMAQMVLWISSHHEAFVTPYIVGELLDNTWKKEPQALPKVYAFLDLNVVTILDDKVVVDESPKISDPDDQIILDTAIYHRVDIIISGDKHFRNLTITRPRVMEATQFREEFMPEND